MGLFSVHNLYTFHLPLLKKYLISKVKRDHDVVINEVLDSLNLRDKILVRTIFRVGLEKNFSLSPQTFGNSNGKTIFLTFDGKKQHFFLVKPHKSRSAPLKVHPSTLSVPLLPTPPTRPVTPPARVRYDCFGVGPDPYEDLPVDENQYEDIDGPFF